MCPFATISCMFPVPILVLLCTGIQWTPCKESMLDLWAMYLHPVLILVIIWCAQQLVIPWSVTLVRKGLRYLHLLMDSTTSWLLDWKVLDWNVRGLNDKNKRLLVYNKIDESQCAVVCLQETKCEDFDHSFIRSFCPKRYDRFMFSPSVGASGGIIVLWNSSIF